MSLVRNSLGWSFAQRYVSLFLSVGSTMIIARLLTPGQIGVYSLCAAFVSLGSALRDFGISEYLIQEKELTPAKMRGSFAVAIAVAWMVAAVLFSLRGVASDFYHEPGVADVLAVLCLYITILPFASPAFALLNRQMAFRDLFVIQTTSIVVHTATSISMAMLGHGFMSLAWANVTSTICQVVLVTYFRPKSSMLLPSFREARGIWSYGALYSATGLLNSLSNNVHEFVIGRQFGFSSLGIFSRAVGLMGQFYENIASAIQRVATPAFAADHRAGHSLHYAYGRAMAIYTSVAWPFYGFVAIMAPDLIQVLLGSQWHAAAPIAVILSIGSMIASLHTLAPCLLAAIGQVKRRLQTTSISCPVNVIGVVAAASFGLEAVAVAMSITWVVQLVLYSFHVNKVVSFSPGDMLRATAPSMRIAALSILALGLAASATRTLGYPALVTLAIVALAGATAWLACVFGFRHPIHDELRRVWAALRASRSR